MKEGLIAIFIFIIFYIIIKKNNVMLLSYSSDEMSNVKYQLDDDINIINI